MFQYYIDYNVIPFSSNIENNFIKLEESVNIIVPNYKQKYENDEKYFIYFRFEKNISKLEINIIYENIIMTEDKENNFIIHPGINILQLENQKIIILKLSNQMIQILLFI